MRAISSHKGGGCRFFQRRKCPLSGIAPQGLPKLAISVSASPVNCLSQSVLKCRMQQTMERDASARRKSPQGLEAAPSLDARLLTPLCLLTTNRALNATEPARERCSILLCNHHRGHFLWSKSPATSFRDPHPPMRQTLLLFPFYGRGN